MSHKRITILLMICQLIKIYILKKYIYPNMYLNISEIYCVQKSYFFILKSKINKQQMFGAS